MSRIDGYQGPTNGEIATTYADFWRIVTHLAFRIGVIDARDGRPFDHDRIADRLRELTPERAWIRLGSSSILDADQFELAQLRYEEGRQFWLVERPRFRSWGHPDYPPASVREYLRARCKNELEERARRVRAELETAPCITRQLKQETLPLFAARREKSEANP